MKSGKRCKEIWKKSSTPMKQLVEIKYSDKFGRCKEIWQKSSTPKKCLKNPIFREEAKGAVQQWLLSIEKGPGW